MTLFSGEPDPDPTPPGVSRLAQTLQVLLREARASGRRRKAELPQGLRLDVFPEAGTWGVALSREDAPPAVPGALQLVGGEGRLAGHDVHLRRGGRHWVILRPPEPREEPSPPEDTGLPDDTLRALLLGPGPWRNSSLSPGMAEARAAAVKSMRHEELREELAWARRHWPEAVEEALMCRAPAEPKVSELSERANVVAPG